MRSKPVRRRRRGLGSSFSIGLITLVVALIGIYLNFTKAFPWDRPYEASILFESRTGMAAGSPVRIAGVDVGEVVGYRPGPGNTSEIRVRISDEGLPIRADAVASIRPRLFLEGNFFVDLEPGTPHAEELPRGGTIPVGQTRIPVFFDQVLTTFTSDARADFRTTLRALSGALDEGGAEALRGALDELRPAFRGVAVSAEAVRGRGPRDLSRLISAAADTAEAISRDQPSLSTLISSFARSSAAFADHATDLRSSIRGLDEVTAAADRDLPAINEPLPEVRALIRELRPGLRAMPPALEDTRPLLRQLRLALRPREAGRLLEALRPVVRDLAGFAPVATRVFNELRDPVSCLIDNAVPVLKSTIEDPPHTTGEPVYRELLYTLSGLASATQNFDGNGFYTRYLGGIGDQIISTGEIPSLGESLFGTAEQPILGSRPRFTGQEPPMRPDAPCTEQEPTDLVAETGPGGMTSVAGTPRTSGLLDDVESVEDAIRRLQRAGRQSVRRLERAVDEGRLTPFGYEPEQDAGEGGDE